MDEDLSRLARAVRAEPDDLDSHRILAALLARLGDAARAAELDASLARLQEPALWRLAPDEEGHAIVAMGRSDGPQRHVCSCCDCCCACCRRPSEWRWLRWDEHLGSKPRVPVRAVDHHGLRPDADVLGELHPLESLTGSREATNADLRAIGRLGSLRALSFHCSRQANDDGLWNIGSLRMLETLSISGGHFTGEGFESMAELRPPLRCAKLFNATKLGDDALLFLGELDTLEELDLTWCDRIGDEGLSYLGDADRLRILDLASCGRVGDRGIEALGELPALERLDLSGTAVTDRGLAVLEALPALNDLRLRSCPITEEGVVRLARKSSLRRLTIGSGGIGDRGLRAIATLTELSHLHLEAPTATDAGLAALGDLRDLATLVLGPGPGVSQSALERLRSALPATVIRFLPVEARTYGFANPIPIA